MGFHHAGGGTGYNNREAPCVSAGLAGIKDVRAKSSAATTSKYGLCYNRRPQNASTLENVSKLGGQDEAEILGKGGHQIGGEES